MNLIIRWVTFISNVVLFFPTSWQSSSNPSQNEIIKKMGEWGFEYFKGASMFVEESIIQLESDDQALPIDSFNLVAELMKGEKSNWSKKDLLKILKIGDKFIATGESYEKILNRIAKANHEHIIDKETVCMFNLLKFEISQPEIEVAIDYSNDQLVLNRAKVHAEKKEQAIKYFLNKAKYFNDMILRGFFVPYHTIFDFQSYLLTRNVQFFQYDDLAVIDTKRGVIIDVTDIKSAAYIRLFCKNITSISSAFKLIPSNSLTRLDIYYPEIQVVVENLKEMIDKMDFFLPLQIYGDLEINFFGPFYLRIIELLSKVTFKSHWEFNNIIQLFSSANQKLQHQELLMNSEYERQYDGPSIQLDLADELKYFSPDQELSVGKYEYSSILMDLDSPIDLRLLSKAFSKYIITHMQLRIDSSFDKYNQLFDLFKSQNFKVLTLTNTNGTNPLTRVFYAKLMNTTSFGSKLEYLDCTKLAFEEIIQLLDSPLPNLRRFRLDIYDDYNENCNIKPIEAVKKLIINFKISNQNKDLLKFVKLFPTLEEITIVAFVDFDDFFLNDSDEKERWIQGSQLKNESALFKYLTSLPTLKSVHIKQYNKEIKWKQEKGHIFYDITLV